MICVTLVTFAYSNSLVFNIIDPAMLLPSVCKQREHASLVRRQNQIGIQLPKISIGRFLLRCNPSSISIIEYGISNPPLPRM